MVQYIPNYNALKQSILEQLELKPQAFLSILKLCATDARVLAEDLSLSCLFNSVLERFYFRKATYNKLNAHEYIVKY